jgi:transposase
LPIPGYRCWAAVAPFPEGMDDRDLEARLYRKALPPAAQRPQPDWAEVHRELRRKGVTLQLLWMEFKQRCPEGHQYNQFVQHYRQWAGRLDVVRRQDHRAGEKLFLDFSGQTLPITDPVTGVVAAAQLFVAVLGASNYTYAEALPSQELLHWIAAHVRMFEYLGGVPEILVPDNLRSGVTRTHRYEPELNPTYLEMAAHYGCAVIPTRPYKPQDKAKVEAGVLLVERWILASLRHQTFFSLAEANLAIRERLNERHFQKLDGSRRCLFEQLDRPALRPLPDRPYEFATWKVVTVNIDYHVEVDRHY